jgi:hypothetical protein
MLDEVGMKMGWRGLMVSAITGAVVLCACQSRFGDKDPDSGLSGVSFSGPGANRLSADEDLDQRIAKVEDFSERIRKILHDYRRIQKAQSGRDVYTQLDFLFDMDSELKRAPAIKDDKKFVKYGKMELNLPTVSAECKMIESKLETFSSQDGEIADSLAYSVKTCKTQGAFRQVMTVQLSENSSGLVFDNDGMKMAFGDLLTSNVKNNSGCKFQFDDNRQLKQASCENVAARISASERIVFDKFAYDAAANPRFITQGIVFENETPKLRVSFSMDNADHPAFELVPLN